MWPKIVLPASRRNAKGVELWLLSKPAKEIMMFKLVSLIDGYQLSTISESDRKMAIGCATPLTARMHRLYLR